MASSRSVDDPVIMTREGYDNLKRELSFLRGEGRVEIASKLEEARGFGDLSENAEYHAAKEEQEKLEGRIAWLEYQLSKAKVVEAEDVDSSQVNLGTTVVLLDLDQNKEYIYTLVGSEEANPTSNRISSQSPVGKAILGKLQGDEVSVRVPKGQRRIKIVDIRMS